MITLDEILNEIEFEISNRTLDPNRAAELLVYLGVKYSRAVDNKVIAEAEFAREFTKERANYKSDTATERALSYGEIGLKVAHWKAQRDKSEQLIVVLKGYIYQKGSEARNEQ